MSACAVSLLNAETIFLLKPQPTHTHKRERESDVLPQLAALLRVQDGNKEIYERKGRNVIIAYAHLASQIYFDGHERDAIMNEKIYCGTREREREACDTKAMCRFRLITV
jgi:hypothetical protein